MKTVFLTDLLVLKRIGAQLLPLFFVVSCVIGFCTASLYTLVGCMSAMSPFIVLFSLVAYDDLKGWESFRASLPVSRRDMVLGRYLSVLSVSLFCACLAVLAGFVIGNIALGFPGDEGIVSSFAMQSDYLALIFTGVVCFSLLIALVSFSFPIIMKYGLTKGTRLFPLLLVLLIPLVSFGLQQVIPEFDPMEALAWLTEPKMIVAAFFLSLALYGLSALLSMRIYRNKEL